MKRVFISYSADSEEHRARVLALANQLRREGVDATLDAFAPSPAEGWRARAIDEAGFVLAICTERYKAEFEARGQGGGGGSGADEAEEIAQVAARRPGRVVPVLLEGGQPTSVPQALRAVPAVYLPEQLPQLLQKLGATGAPVPPLQAAAPQAMGPAAAPQAQAAERASKRAQRRISNVSLLGSPDYVGRTFELSAIRTALAAARQNGSGEPLIVIGATGIGKTALVLQHAFRQQEAYDVIWLVRAESDSTIRLDLALLARELGLLAPGTADDEAEVLAARAWLAAHDRWLLIFDEAPGAGALAAYVPRPLRGHVLVTSRGSDWREAGKKLLLGALAREESIDLLLRASGRGEAGGADELAAWLEGHPLMSKLAGALARDRGVSLDVLHRQLAGGAGQRPSQRLEAILAMAVEDARQRSPAILALVELIAYLAPHEIPIRLLREHVEHLPPELGAVARDDNALVRLLDDLVRVGMATRDDSSLSVHAAVQAAIRATARSGAAVALLDAAFQWDEEHPETWAAAEELLPHVLVAIEDPNAPAARPRELQRLLARTAACMWKRGEPYRAIALQRRAIALIEARPELGAAPAQAAAAAAGSEAEARAGARPAAASGAPVEAQASGGPADAKASAVPAEAANAPDAPDAPDAAKVPDAPDAAKVPNAPDAAKVPDAPDAPPDPTPEQPRYWREVPDAPAALVMRDERDVAGSPAPAQGGAVAGSLVTLGSMLREVGELAEAAQQLERARGLLAAEGGADAVPVLRELARVAAARGDFGGARARLEQALALDRARLGVEDHLSIAATLADLSGVEVEADRLDEAAELLERALAMQRRLLSTDDHPAVAATLKRSAAILARRGDLPEARARLERALDVLRRVLRTDHHVAIVDVMNELASVLMRLGDPIGAQRLLEQTLESQARLFGGGANPGGAAVSYNLARVLILQGDLMGARRLLERALAGLHTQGVVPMHPTVAAILEQLGELEAPSDLAGARVRYEQALEIRRELAGPGSPEAMQAAASLAQVAARLGNPDEAAELLEPILAHVLGPGEVQLRAGAPEALFVTADVLGRLGRAASARDLLLGVLASLERGRADALTLARGRLALARIYLQLEDLVEARREARDAHEMLIAALGAGSLADGDAALLRAGIALRGDELASAFGLAARARRIFDGKGDAAARDAAARALELAGRAALGLERRATAATLLQHALERRDAPEVRETLFELIEELAAAGSPYDPAPAVGVLQRLAPSWLADRVFAAATLDAAQITTQLEVALSVAGAATAAAITPILPPPAAPAAPAPAAPAAAPTTQGAARESVAALIRARHREHAQKATYRVEAWQGAGAPDLESPTLVHGPHQLASSSASSAASAPAAEYGFRLELAPIRAEGVASEVRTLEARPRLAGPGRLALVASTADLPWGTYMLAVRFVDGARTVWRADVTIGNAELGNPFLAGPPVKGERFFGRGRLLDEMIRHLEDASIVLLGPRRSGKTSVLYRLQQLCADGWTVVVVDLHGYSGVDDRVFLRELAGQIARAAGVDAPEADRPLLELRRALAAAGTRRILLLLDEMAILARYPDAALQLRAMSKWESPVVRVVIAGTSRDLDRLTSTTARGSSPVNEFLNRELDQLTRQEALALLEQPVLGRYRYEPAALDRLLELGAGRPFFLNALAHLTLEVVRQEGVRVITAAHVEAARQEAQHSLARWYRELVGELDDASRAALPALIAAGGPIPIAHAEALRSAGIVIGPRRAMTLDPIFIDWWHRGGSR